MDATDLPIADPCHADWEAMDPEGARRFCGHCSRHVHDLSAMREAEARALLAASSRVCVRYTVGGDGKIRFQPEPAVTLVTLRRGGVAAARGAGARGRAGVAAVLLAACTPHEPGGAEAPLPSAVEGEVKVVGTPTVIPYVPPPPPGPPVIPVVGPSDEGMGVRMGDVAGPRPSPPPARKLMGKPAPRAFAPPPPKAPEPCDGPPRGDEVFMGEAPAMLDE